MMLSHLNQRQLTGKMSKKQLMAVQKIRNLPPNMLDETLEKLGRPLFFGERNMEGSILHVTSYDPLQLKCYEPCDIQVASKLVPGQFHEHSLPVLHGTTNALTKTVWDFDKDSGLFVFNPRLGEIVAAVLKECKVSRRSFYQLCRSALSALF